MPRFPSLHDERFMTYQAIANGARGLNYFGGHITQIASPEDSALGWNWAFWEQTLRPVVRELASPELQVALVAPDVKPGVKTATAGMELVTRRTTNYVFVIAVRRGGTTSRVTFTACRSARTEAPIATGRVLFEYEQRPLPPPVEPGATATGTIDVEDGAFTDWFAPHDASRLSLRAEPRAVCGTPRPGTTLAPVHAAASAGPVCLPDSLSPRSSLRREARRSARQLRHQIVFSATREATLSGEIYRVTLDGRVTRLAKPLFERGSPRLARRQLGRLFLRSSRGREQPRGLSRGGDGRKAIRLSPRGRAFLDEPLWSHDGQYLLAVGQIQERSPGHVRARAHGSRARLPGTGGEFPVWSPDDRRVAFETETGAYRHQSVRVVPVAGGWGWHVPGSRPVWSPTGRVALIGPGHTVRAYDAVDICSRASPCPASSG